MNNLRYYLGEFYNPVCIVFEGEEVYRLPGNDHQLTQPEKWVAMENSGINDDARFKLSVKHSIDHCFPLNKMYKKVDLYDAKLTPSQEETIEWLLERAQRSFLESKVNAQSKWFNWELMPGHKSVCLRIYTQSKPNTGFLSWTDRSYLIWIGKRGGIQSAKEPRSGTSDSEATLYARRGIFVL